MKNTDYTLVESVDIVRRAWRCGSKVSRLQGTESNRAARPPYRGPRVEPRKWCAGNPSTRTRILNCVYVTVRNPRVRGLLSRSFDQRSRTVSNEMQNNAIAGSFLVVAHMKKRQKQREKEKEQWKPFLLFSQFQARSIYVYIAAYTREPPR